MAVTTYVLDAGAKFGSINLTNLTDIQEQKVGNTTTEQTDNARTIEAAYKDALMSSITITTVNSEFYHTDDLNPGKVAELVLNKVKRLEGGDPDIDKPLVATYPFAMVDQVTLGTPSQGRATISITFIAYDPEGKTVVKYTRP